MCTEQSRSRCPLCFSLSMLLAVSLCSSVPYGVHRGTVWEPGEAVRALESIGRRCQPQHGLAEALPRRVLSRLISKALRGPPGCRRDSRKARWRAPASHASFWALRIFHFPPGNSRCLLKGAALGDRRSPPRPLDYPLLAAPACAVSHRINPLSLLEAHFKGHRSPNDPQPVTIHVLRYSCVKRHGHR